jgi:RNA polymerase sigma factor FliA
MAHSAAAAAKIESRPFDLEATRYVPLVRRVATRLARRLPSHVDVEDLVSAGMLGLLDSATPFDQSRARQFDTFAEFRIRGAMLDELRSVDPLSRDMRSHMKALHAATHRLEGELGRPPTTEELAAALGLTLEGYHAMLADLRGHTVASLDELCSAEGLQVAVDGEDPCEATVHAEARAAVAAAIQALPEREGTVLKLYYFADLSLKEIGAILEVTESRVCQIHSQATEKLRRALIHLAPDAS